MSDIRLRRWAVPQALTLEEYHRIRDALPESPPPSRGTRTHGTHPVAAAIVDRKTWMGDAACRGHDPNIWFPVSKGGAQASQEKAAAPAIAICRTCPVTGHCLAHALDDLELRGVWGATTRRQRLQLARRNLTRNSLRRNP